jgi:hypothetical protein
MKLRLPNLRPLTGNLTNRQLPQEDYMNNKPLDFVSFINERNSISMKKAMGCLPPWTTDEVLNETRITNLDRKLDRGTIRLIEKVQNLPDNMRINIIVLYRTGYSSLLLLNALSGDPATDIAWLRGNHNSFIKRMPYQVLMHEEETIEDLMIKSCFDVSAFILNRLPHYDHASLENVANDIAMRFKQTHGYNMIFLGTEVAKDLSYFYENEIDRDSICPFNKGARRGLSLMYKQGMLPNTYAIESRVSYLKSKTGFNYEKLEHTLCEYAKYLDRWKVYAKTPRRIPKQWLYTPSSEPIYRLCDSVIA